MSGGLNDTLLRISIKLDPLSQENGKFDNNENSAQQNIASDSSRKFALNL